MKICPFCAEEIQDQAIKCRYCGEFLDGRPRTPAFGYEYRSKAQIGGWPLIHIVQGRDPATGRPRVARGIIAIGDVAIGGLAVGGVAIGGLALGGFSLGALAIGGVALGWAALGGMAVAVYLAAGGMAASLNYAIGGFALGDHVISGSRVDPELKELLEAWLARLQGEGR